MNKIISEIYRRESDVHLIESAGRQSRRCYGSAKRLKTYVLMNFLCILNIIIHFNHYV